MRPFSPSTPLPLGLWTPYHTSVAVPLPDKQPHSVLSPQTFLSPVHSSTIRSNSVPPIVMVSDPMDALYGADASRVITHTSPILFFFADAKWALKGPAADPPVAPSLSRALCL